ncbi:hypothetical protein FJY94_06560 [Candidatus Kaiserbacteria bacterium]|nr:hypothetical protein [Candidatus Kaiserbacteria bacterium]
MPMRVSPSGPTPARVLVVGEAPGGDEERLGTPFVGPSGMELDRMLHDSGFIRAECRVTNVVPFRPPGNDIELWLTEVKKDAAERQLTRFHNGQYYNDLVAQGLVELAHEISTTRPTVIIALGATALWALSGHSGITDWRGSVLPNSLVPGGPKVVPTYHPALVLRQWEWRPVAVHDLRRALREAEYPEIRTPPYRFSVRPSYETCMETLTALRAKADSGQLPLAVDIETRSGFIACTGIAWSRLDALCIPQMCVETADGYFPRDQEYALTTATRELLTHPNVRVIGQNFLYDAQYFADHYGYVPNVAHDTMFQQHVAFAGMPKALDFLSSMYCEFHQFWKHEGKEWNARTTPEDQLWVYNCKDAVITFEVWAELQKVVADLKLTPVYEFQMRLWYSALRCMLRGVRIDRELRKQLGLELLNEIAKREQELIDMVGHPLNPRSPKQMHGFFYDQLALPVQRNRKTRRPSLDDEALDKLCNKEPIIRPVVRNILEQRSIGVFNSTFVGAALDPDHRIRCSFNPAGTETYRLSSSKNAFGNGTNLQNIPKGDEDDVTLSADDLRLPNIRKLFIPDLDHTIFDCDLSGADAQVVAWEADDPLLKRMFREKVKIHAHNARDLFGPDAGPDGKREPYYSRTKQGVHLSNYGGTARTLAATIGISVHEAEHFQRRWFSIHPQIRDWHRRIESELQTRRFITNKFGYRRFYFGRVEELLPEALAWIPQSTVACVTNRAWEAIDREVLEVEILLQVHDSLVGQYLTRCEERLLATMYPIMQITVPYDDPLIIPWGLKTSTRSWGDCNERKWPELGAK